VCELLFVGADTGDVNGRRIPFERSLSLAHALHQDTLLATHLSGEPLEPEHGAPVRLVVPGWYGVASVKWLVEVRALTRPYTGFFQTGQYTYRDSRDRLIRPVTTTRVKSLIVTPTSGTVVTPNRAVEVRGWAWSGSAPIARVEVSDDGGVAWRVARLAKAGRYAWTGWVFSWVPQNTGAYRVLVRATDVDGHLQPLETPWNALGYGSNAVSSVDVLAYEGVPT
jgi:DMSO/TMAO reductase YedYZ molybdopterin-dependent catalytic subunit